MTCGVTPRCRLAGWAAPALAALVLARGVAAQTTGTIEGKVRDSSGAALAGATVEASSPSLQGVRTVATDAAGAFRMPGVPPGLYRLHARLAGFREVERVVMVGLNAAASVEFSLGLAASEEITVGATETAIDPTSTATGTRSAPSRTATGSGA